MKPKIWIILIVAGFLTSFQSMIVKPNIILVLTDDQTYESIAKMPYVSSLEWITFDNAYENVGLCCPTRATILTGQYDTHTGVLNNMPPDDGQALNELQTLPVWLNGAGYTTGLFGKYLNGYPWDRGNYIPPGWDRWISFFEPAGIEYKDYQLYEDGVVKSYANYSTDTLFNKAITFIKTTEPPFFVYLVPKTPHAPYTPAARHVGIYADEPVIHDPNFNEADVSDKPQYIRNLSLVNVTTEDSNRRKQWEMMLVVDEGMERIDLALAEMGLTENTVVIFMTDNGFAHGEHRWVAKKCPYDVCLKTPLLIRYPGQPARHITELVSDVDIAPTLLELAGGSPGLVVDGVSLVPLIENTNTSWRTEILNHWGGGGTVQRGNPPIFWSIRTDQYRYTELIAGAKELYDYSIDPYELTNLINDSDYDLIQADLKARLDALKLQAE
jgi:arylsulfatase A-like enzyme